MSDFSHIGALFSAEEESCLSLESMQDYAAGKLPAVQAHAVERHLLNCELCSLAYEGLAEADPAEVAAGVSAITDTAWERVAALEKRKRRGAFIWMSTAASILILIVAGYFVLDRPDQPSYGGLAERMLESSDELDASTSTESGAGEFAENRPPAAPPLEGINPTDGNLDRKQVGKDDPDNGDNWKDQPEIQKPSLVAGNESSPDPFYYQNEDADPIIEDPSDADFISDLTEETTVMLNDRDEVANVVSAPKPNAAPLKDLETFNGITTLDSTLSFNWEMSGNKSGVDEVVASVDMEESEEENGYLEAFDTASDDDFDGLGEPLEVEALEEVVASKEVYTRSTNQQTITLGSVNTVDEKNRSDGTPLNATTGGLYTSDYKLDQQEADKAMVSSDAKPRKAKGKRFKKVGKAQENKYADAPKAEQAPPATKNEFEQGMDAYNIRDYRVASQRLRQAAADTPDNLQAHLFAARSFLELKQPVAAIYHLDRILAGASSSYIEDAKWFKSIALLQMGDQQNAEKLLKELETTGGKRSKAAKEALDQF